MLELEVIPEHGLSSEIIEFILGKVLSLIFLKLNTSLFNIFNLFCTCYKILDIIIVEYLGFPVAIFRSFSS